MLSIGIDSTVGSWKTCLMEDGQPREFSTFIDAQATFSYVNRICAGRPEVVIALSSSQESSFVSLNGAIQEQAATETELREAQDFLRATSAIHLKSYLLPAIKYLPGVPRYRRLKYGSMGTAHQLCSVATLFYRMRQQDAAWPEISFLSLEVGVMSYSITVVRDGYIVDGMGEAPILDEEAVDKEEREQAFWERLLQDLAGLMAVHHLEDVVLGDRNASARKQSVIDRLEDNYQLYLFPRRESEPEEFEVAIGASILAEGLHRPGLAAEVTARLLSSLAQS